MRTLVVVAMKLTASWEGSRFEEMSWHDNHVHGLAIREGKYGFGELDLDLDYIVEWLCPVDAPASFRLAPATLTFLEVADLRIEIDYAAVTAGMTPFSISLISRTATPWPQRFQWTIELNWPKGMLSFHASGFRQMLRRPPVVREGQSLRHDER